MTILPSQPPRPVRRPPSPRVALIGIAALAAIAVVVAFVTGALGGSGSKSPVQHAPAAGSSLAGLTGADIVARAQAAARQASTMHLELDTHNGGREVKFSDDDYATSGIQRVTSGAARAEVRVIGRTTYFTGNAQAITGFFGMPSSAVLPAGTWYRLVPGDAQYTTVTEGVTFASALHEMNLSAPYTVLPVAQIHGVPAVGVRGHVPGAPAGVQAVGTLWIAASGASLPVEYDATGGDITMTVTFSNWDRAGHVARPAHVRPAPKQTVVSSPVADADMKINLRNLATIEETYLTDSGTSYGTARQLRRENLAAIKLAPGQTITIHLAGMNGYCLAGKVAAGRYFVYSSQEGGLTGPVSSDTCSASTYPANGGQLPLR